MSKLSVSDVQELLELKAKAAQLRDEIKQAETILPLRVEENKVRQRACDAVHAALSPRSAAAAAAGKETFFSADPPASPGIVTPKLKPPMNATPSQMLTLYW